MYNFLSQTTEKFVIMLEQSVSERLPFISSGVGNLVGHRFKDAANFANCVRDDVEN
jgi:hypothetical protein